MSIWQSRMRAYAALQRQTERAAIKQQRELERLLHAEFEEMRMNKVNYRKEFFRVPLDRVRTLLGEKGLETTFTMLAEAHEYRETQVLNKMTPEEREKYHLQRDQSSVPDGSS